MAEGVDRRLAAILAADVVGYSRLMEADEEGTHARLKTCRVDFIEPAVDANRGRIVKLTGDGALIEFPSVVAATRCAVEVQRGMAARNDDVPEDKRIMFRIGINVGDVIDDEDDIYGDGVNVAARLESMAPPGGIWVSGDAFRQVEGKVDVGFEDLGEHQVKNIERPVHVYQIALASTDGRSITRFPTRRQRSFRWGLVAATCAALIAVTAWWQGRHPGSQTIVPQRSSLELPERPSIAILPFVNLSEDAKSDYLGDGITEDLITDLSQISGLFVIAHNSSRRYSDQTNDLKQISHDLGVQYILRGSIRPSEEEIRINAQLVDTTSGRNLWAERYDRELSNIFVLQDDITDKIVRALQVELTGSELERRSHHRTSNAEAYDAFLRAKTYRWRLNPEHHAKARVFLEKAIELDPGFAAPRAMLAMTYFVEWIYQWSAGPASFDKALEYAESAAAADPYSAYAHSILGFVTLWHKDFEAAVGNTQRALEIEPNSAIANGYMAAILHFTGDDPEKAIDYAKRAMRLDPHYTGDVPMVLGHTLYSARRYEEAIQAYNEAIRLNPDLQPAHRWLAAIYGELGDKENAQKAVAEVLRISPKATIRAYQDRLPYKNPVDLERFLDGLRMAGLPEGDQ